MINTLNIAKELQSVGFTQAQSEMMSVGHVTPDTMKTLLRNPMSLDRCISIGLLAPEIKQLANLNKAPALEAIECVNIPLLVGAKNE